MCRQKRRPLLYPHPVFSTLLPRGPCHGPSMLLNYIALEDPQETERKENGVLILDAYLSRRRCPYHHLGLEHEQHLPSVDADSVRFTMLCIRRCTQYATTFAFRISTLFRTRCYLASATRTYYTTHYHSTVLLLYPNLISSS